MYYELYLITNKLNNKKYVGQTISSKGYLKRFEEHCDLAMAGDPSCLHQAMKKYGVTNFSVKLLLHNIDDSQIDFYETLWINKLNTYYGNHKGYNMTFGGRGTKGYVFTEDVRLRMSSGSKNYWKNLSQDEYLKLCKMRSDNMKGKKFSPEHKQKISEWAKTRTGEKNPFYGKHHSDKVKQQISNINSKPIGMFSLNDEFLMCFSSLKDATTYLINNNITDNINASSRISKICRGLGKTAYGFIWKFL